jgi:hypothetical protein
MDRNTILFLCKMFPTQIARIMSARVGMAATFCLSSIFNQVKVTDTQDDPN